MIDTTNDWIEWHGGKQPVPDGTVVELKYRNGWRITSISNMHRWNHFNTVDDIILYRVIREAEKPAQESAVEKLERKFESARQYRLRCAASPDTYENLAMTAVECAQTAFYLRAYTRHAKELDALRAIFFKDQKRRKVSPPASQNSSTSEAGRTRVRSAVRERGSQTD